MFGFQRNDRDRGNWITAHVFILAMMTLFRWRVCCSVYPFSLFPKQERVCAKCYRLNWSPISCHNENIVSYVKVLTSTSFFKVSAGFPKRR